jgi:type I restriction enzyme R subunit
VRAVLAKSTPGERKTDEELDHAIRQIISQGGRLGRGRGHLRAAGLKKPDISILSDEFLAEVRGMPQRNLAVELLQKLLRGRSSRGEAQRRAGALLCGPARAGAAQVPEPRHRDGAGDRGADPARQGHARRPTPRRGLGLSEDELAFYDALETNDSAVKVLGDDDARRSRVSLR